jgi:hypothetical protein
MYDHCRLVRGAQAGNGPKANGKENDILWALGLVTGYTMGYFIHILLVIAIIVVLLRVIQGRKVI